MENLIIRNMENFKLLKIAIIIAIISSSLSSCDIAYSYGLPKKIGDTEVTFKDQEILVKKFPHYTQGVVGLNQVSFGTFSFDELDEYIYKVAKKSSLKYIYITIQYLEEDNYGKKTDGKRITIGTIDVNDTKNYVDFNHWKSKYSSADMFFKDKVEYNDIRNAMTYTQFFPAYEPKDIRNVVPWNIENMKVTYHKIKIADSIRIADSIVAAEAEALLGGQSNTVCQGGPGLVVNEGLRERERQRIEGELRWTNPTYLKNRMDKILVDVLGQDYIETGGQFNYACERSEEFYKLINRYIELTGENPYN